MEKQFPAPGSKRGGLGGGRRETERVGALARAVEGGIIGRRAYIPHTQQTRCLACYFSHGGTWLALNENVASEQMLPQPWFISNLNLCWTLSRFLPYVVKWCLKRQRKLSSLDRAQF